MAMDSFTQWLSLALVPRRWSETRLQVSRVRGIYMGRAELGRVGSKRVQYLNIAFFKPALYLNSHLIIIYHLYL